jgi:hypothetical protein
MVDTEGTRNADDIDRPSQIFPAITTPTDLKRHSRPHRGMDVLPSSSFKISFDMAQLISFAKQP